MKIKEHVFKLISFIILVSLFIILFFAGYLAVKSLTKDDVPKELIIQNMVHDKVKRLNQIIESVQKIPQELTYILQYLDVDENEMQILQESVLAYNIELFGCAIAFEPYQFNKDSLYFAPYVYRSDKKYLFTNLSDPEYDYFNQDWYLVPKTLMQPTWSEPYYDEGGGNSLMSTYSVPFYSFDGVEEKFNGIVTVDVSIEWLEQLFVEVGKRFEGQVILISENGTIIFAKNKEWIYNETIYTLAEELNLPLFREIGRELKNGKTGSKKIAAFDDNVNWLVAYANIKSNKWSLLYFLPEDQLINY